MSEGICRKTVRAEATVIGNEALGSGCFVVTLEVPEIASMIEPAHFVMLRGLDPGFPYLPRPFSVFDVSGGDTEATRIEILYEVVGSGTAAMARWTGGEKVYCLGPLGRSFDTSSDSSHSVFLAGGIGIAPFPFLARRLKTPPERQILLFGARSKSALFALDRFEALGIDIRIATDDGSEGRKGNSVELLSELLDELSPSTPEVFACGPTPMFKAAQKVVVPRGVPTQMSLEERMACGYGACVGCVQAIDDPESEDGWRYALICVEGPVFDAERVLYTRPVPTDS